MLRMSTHFGGFRHRGRNRELPLVEYPEWGLDILRGLYGSETVDSILAEQQLPGQQLSGPSAGIDDLAHLDNTSSTRGVGPDWGVEPAGDASVKATPQRSAADDDAPIPPEILTPMLAEIEAINAMLRWLKRTFARH